MVDKNRVSQVVHEHEEVGTTTCPCKSKLSEPCRDLCTCNPERQLSTTREKEWGCQRCADDGEVVTRSKVKMFSGVVNGEGLIHWERHARFCHSCGEDLPSEMKQYKNVKG